MANSIVLLDNYKGLGTAFWVELFLDEHEEHADFTLLRERLQKEITLFDATYSRFKEDSLLSELNRNHVIKYDHHLATMLLEGKEASKITHTVFNLFIKEALEEKGYGNVEEKQMKSSSIHEESDVVIDNETITLLGNKGIDLGGIGKGYLIDMLTTILKVEFGLQYFVINGGGDIYLTSNHGKEIELYLEHPVREGEYLGTISLQNKALCVSSSFKRRWKKGEEDVNHFVAEKEVWAASYVVSTTATIADIYATVCCIEANNDTNLEQIHQKARFEYLTINEHGEMKKSSGFPNIH